MLVYQRVCATDSFVENWWRKICVFVRPERRPWEKKITWQPSKSTATNTPSRDFWPIRLVLHQVCEGPRVLRWPGVVGKLFLKVGIGTNQYNCMDNNKYTHTHIYIYIIHPWNLTWKLKMMVSKRNLLFQGLPFSGSMLNFGGVMYIVNNRNS